MNKNAYSTLDMVAGRSAQMGIGMQKVLHLLASGGIGGIEKLCATMYPYLTQQHDFCFFWSNGIHAELLEKQGANTYFLDAYAGSMGKTLKQINRLCEKNRYDVVIVHHASPLMWVAAVLAKNKFGVKVYLYAHSDAKLFLGKNTAQYLKQIIFWKYALKHAEKVIAISEFVKNSLIQCGKVKQDRIEVIYNGIDMSYYRECKRKSEKVDSTNTLIYCGRLVPEKGVDYLLKAIKLMSSKDKIQCLIVGDGEQRKSLETLTQELELTSAVTFCGIQNDIQNWLDKADIYIHPAICEEGFGISLVEAMAAGMICIAFRKGGIPEFLEDGFNGFLVDTITPRALANAIENTVAIIGTEYEKELRMKAKDTASKYDIQFMAKNLEKLINNV